MATITATPLPALGIVKILVDWTSAPDQQSDLIEVYRIAPDGTATPVIGAPLYLSGGKALLYDTSPPLDTPLTYRAYMATANRAWDQFQRSVSNGWGTADRGGAWTVTTGATSDYSTTGNAGMHVLPPAAIRTTTLAEVYTNVQAAVTAFGSGLPSNTQTLTLAVALRYTSTSAYYRLGVEITSTGVMDAVIQRRTASPSTPVTLVRARLPYTYTANTQVRIEGQAVGSLLRVRAWVGDNRPTAWSASITDTTWTSGRAGAFSHSTSGGSLNSFYDNFRADSLVPQTITSTSVTLATSPDGWIRDPYLPAQSVRLDNCATHTFSCLNAERFVFFQGFEEEDYESATGVFGVLDAERPITVAQTRKDLTTVMRVVSTTLADIPALRALFRPGRDLVVSVPTEYGWGIETYGTDWATVGNVTVARLNRRDMRKPQRVWSLPMAVTDPDDSRDAYGSGSTSSNQIPVPGATYGDMKATGLTYGQLAGTSFPYPLATVSDAFQRTGSNGWGTADTGQVWGGTFGSAADLSLTAGTAVASHGTVNALRGQTIDTGVTDHMVTAGFMVPVLPTGSAITVRLLARVVDASNHYFATLSIAPSGSTSLVIEKRLAGTATQFPGGLTVGTHSAGHWWQVVLDVRAGALRAKAWNTNTTAEPATWQITATDGSPFTTGTRAGMLSRLEGGNTNTLPLVISADLFHAAPVSSVASRTYLDWAQGVFV